jgi:drug/metabolite transporter (DMT)-like permease
MSLKSPPSSFPRNNRTRTVKVYLMNITSSRNLETFLVIAAAATTIILFALTPATTLVAAAQIDGFSIGIIRTVGGGLVALPLLLVFRLQPPQRWNDWRLLILSAFGSFAGFPILFSLGSQSTSASHAALIMAVMPLLVGVAGMTLDRRLPRIGWFIGASVAIVGESVLFAFRDAGSVEASAAGDALVLCGCIMFAVGVVAGARLTARFSPWAATLWALTLAGLALAPLAVLRITTVPLSGVAPATWAALLHLTLGATVLANVAWLWALARGGVVRIAPMQFAQPILAVVFASVLLRVAFTLRVLSSAIIIITGIIVAHRAATALTDQLTEA